MTYTDTQLQAFADRALVLHFGKARGTIDNTSHGRGGRTFGMLRIDRGGVPEGYPATYQTVVITKGADEYLVMERVDGMSLNRAPLHRGKLADLEDQS